MKKILIVDDDPELRGNLNTILTDGDFMAEEASSGQGALDLLQTNTYDIILLDLMMPGMNGMETLDHIRKINTRIKVIMITAFATVSNAVEAIKKGASDYITKPFQIDDLLNTIKHILEEVKFEAEMKSLDIDQTLSSLSNSIRREIVYLLSMTESMRLMMLTRALNIEDHTKVIFHLRMLKESELIHQSEDKAYSLTAEGHRIVECLNIFKSHKSCLTPEEK